MFQDRPTNTIFHDQLLPCFSTGRSRIPENADEFLRALFRGSRGARYFGIVRLDLTAVSTETVPFGSGATSPQRRYASEDAVRGRTNL